MTARSRIWFPIGGLALFRAEGPPGVASHSWIPARQEPPLRNQVTALRAHLLASSWKPRTRSPPSMFVPIDKPIQMPVAPSPIFKPADSQVRSRLTSRQCRRTEAAPERPCPRRPPAAMLCAASVTKRLAATTRSSAVSTIVASASSPIRRKELGDLKTRDDQLSARQR